ncbi:carbohydrate kinase [Tabrizicola sp.]|jgi:fructokinase|uniref:carbohydrate kinase family protein n=1 Tax=Tabrizicola sp. TaxID=2005166 RepID=UPI000BD412F5|nr:carbohydrate kinase [Tabrizicola sp.]MBY0351459.1 carbohydrate kinase [Tabrizicola sp.]MDK2774119.1 carbohydrate kinase [Tabrizicola sp.]OYX18075.1 MAG: carbohydrate kinase [Rhodobacterales bacterium 32-66-9]
MILSCGEALIDMLPRTSTEGEACFAPYAGGAVFNTAIALGRLGVPSAFFSGVSNDMLGEILADTLTASKVDTRHLARSDRPTTVAFVKLVNGQATYAFYDEGTAGRLLSSADLPSLPADINALFLGGISLVNDPAASTYEALQARECPTRVTMIDPNIRPGFIAGKEAGYRARIQRMVARADIVKLSDEDLHWLEGQGDLTVLARGILARGPKVVFLTEGANGARAVTATQDVYCAARKVAVVDTVGAGDTFNAGVLAALHQAGVLTKPALARLSDAALSAALDLGTRAAAVTVSRAGANPPWAHEL